MADQFIVEEKKANEWSIKLSGARCATAKCKSEAEAIDTAKKLSKEKGLKQIVLKTKDGKEKKLTV